jgi:orotate phosphoribosyltransferase-like protein
MDKYEQEFRKRMKEAAKSIKVDREELGELRLKRLAAMLYLLIKEKEEVFDLLVGGGNSGVVTIEITKMVYRAVGIKPPPIALFPIVRPSSKQNVQTEIDKSLVEEQLRNVKGLNRLLFVDDEIMRAQTAKMCFETIRNFLGESKVNPCLNCTIVAENHFFIWKYDLKGIAVRFLPFAIVLQGYNGNFGYLIPQKLIKKLEPILGEPINRNQALAILMGGKRKIIKNKLSSFDHEIEKKIINKIENYNKEKQNFIIRIEKLVKEGIEEYKKGNIKFRYI